MRCPLTNSRKKIGIDFFANLPAAIGEDAAAKVEAEDPATVSWWW